MADATNTELTTKFWEALDHSPFVILQLDGNADSASPMTAQLDRDADHAIWFFTYTHNHYAALGAATATFSAKGHELFARFHGQLVRETSRARLDKQWSPEVAAWFPGGKEDPELLLLRLDLGEATIWGGGGTLLTRIKVALGFEKPSELKGEKVTTAL